jgi:anthranilate phosphoribosyltransferase
MSSIVEALHRRDPVPSADWSSLWARLEEQTLPRAEAVAVLDALGARLPDAATFAALVRSLRPATIRREGRTGLSARVNIVGTGGGPATFNISTGAAIVAAAAGVRVIKTGSVGYSSRCGSVDLLRRLGIRLTSSAAETERTVDREGIAFAGGYVYPVAFTRLARLLLPRPLSTYGRLLNLLGPLVADVDVDAQLSGASTAAAVPLLRRAADETAPYPIWWAENDLGTDELLSFAPHRLVRSGPPATSDPGASGPPICEPGAAGAGTSASADAPSDWRGPGLPYPYAASPGTLADLAPSADPAEVTTDFAAALAGHRHRAATETLALNAAGLIVIGSGTSWTEAYGRALAAIEHGAAVDLLQRLRAQPAGHPLPAGARQPATSRPGSR